MFKYIIAFIVVLLFIILISIVEFVLITDLEKEFEIENKNKDF